MRASTDRSWYLVIYDVRDEKRLRQVSKVLKGYGNRVQYSVFRCHARPREVERLKWELTKIMDSEDDIMIVQLCAKCANKIVIGNKQCRWSEEVTTYAII